MMDVSVVVPTYNRRPVLERTVACLLEQDYNPARYEIVVVDDQSTDDTWEWLQEVAAREHRLKVARNRKKGRGQARNAGVEASSGQFICLVDDDVWVVREFVSAHRQAHCEHGARTVGIGSLSTCADTRATVANQYEDARLMRVEKRLRDGGPDIDPGLFRTGNVSVARDFLQAVGGFDECFRGYSYEDSELGFRLKSNGGQFRYVPRAAGVHFTDATVQATLRKKQEAGASAILFLKRWPDAADRVSFPFEVPGVCTTVRHDGLLKGIGIRLFVSAPAGCLMCGMLRLSVCLRWRPAALFWLDVLGHHRYSRSFRQEIRRLTGETVKGDPEAP